MRELPAGTAAGEVTGRLALHGDGEVVVRLRPSGTRDVTTQPIHPEPPPQQHYYRGDDNVVAPPTYQAPMTEEIRAEIEALDAYWMSPPWWSPLRWIPDQRRLRGELRAEADQRLALTAPDAPLALEHGTVRDA